MRMMERKELTQIDVLVSGVLFIGLGIFTFATKTWLLLALSYIFGIVYLVTGLFHVIRLFIQRHSKKDNMTFVSAWIRFILGVFLVSYPNIPERVFARLFALYMLALGIVYGINYIIMKKNQVKGRIHYFFLSIFYLVFSIYLGIAPYDHMPFILNILAVYFILVGVSSMLDLIPVTQKDKMKRRIRISLPVLWQAWIPKVVLDEVNHYLIPSCEKPIDAKSDVSLYNRKEKADVEIFIHASNMGFGKVGHVDVCIDDVFYSYGNYDYNSVRYGELVGDGVMIIAHKEEYIPFVIEDSQKTLFCFGLKLTEEQKRKVLDQLLKIKESVYEWNPPEYQGCDDMYASRLKHACKETFFYKFYEGRFKTYFVPSTNCVQLADYVVGSAGLDVLKMNGLITPGAYYEYLDRQFSLHNEMVIYKKIYN